MKDIQVSKDWLEPPKDGKDTRLRLVPSSMVVSVPNDIADAAVADGAAVHVEAPKASKADKD